MTIDQAVAAWRVTREPGVLVGSFGDLALAARTLRREGVEVVGLNAVLIEHTDGYEELAAEEVRAGAGELPAAERVDGRKRLREALEAALGTWVESRRGAGAPAVDRLELAVAERVDLAPLAALGALLLVPGRVEAGVVRAYAGPGEPGVVLPPGLAPAGRVWQVDGAGQANSPAEE